MAELKLVINDPKTGKAVQKELKDDAVQPFMGLKIGDKVNGELLDLTGYEFEITGGSDFAGFPMRKDVPGTARKRILAISGVGLNNKKKYRKKKKKGLRTMKGMRQRKTVAGNTVFDKTAQLNLKVIKAGKADLFAAPAPEGEVAPAEGEAQSEQSSDEHLSSAQIAPKEEAKQAEAPKEAPKEEAKPEEKKE